MVNVYPAFVSTAWRSWDAARTEYAKSVGVPADAYGARAPAPLGLRGVTMMRLLAALHGLVAVARGGDARVAGSG